MNSFAAALGRRITRPADRAHARPRAALHAFENCCDAKMAEIDRFCSKFRNNELFYGALWANVTPFNVAFAPYWLGFLADRGTAKMRFRAPQQ
jgi:hypothetical protein